MPIQKTDTLIDDDKDKDNTIRMNEEPKLIWGKLLPISQGLASYELTQD